MLPARSKIARVKHHDAVPYGVMPGFMASLRGKSGTSARALEFTILTAARTGEAIGARWSEFDLLAKLWIVPPQRTKALKEHRVALSDRAVQILSGLPRTGDFVFRAAKSDRPISSSAMLELVGGAFGSHPSECKASRRPLTLLF